jgi:hypothetical protein
MSATIVHPIAAAWRDASDWDPALFAWARAVLVADLAAALLAPDSPILPGEYAGILHDRSDVPS